MEKVKLAIPFHLNYELNDKVSEFNVLFDCKFNRLPKILEFCKEYADKRINIEFINFEMEIASSICAVRDNAYVRLTSSQLQYAKDLKEENVRFFFDSDVLAYNLMSLNYLISQGATDVYIADDLWYNSLKVHEYCAERGVSVRLVLNTIPATTPDRGTDCKSPIFAPFDLEPLSVVVDMFEFDLGEKPNWGLCSVLYRSWFERGYWHGQLNDINEEVQMDWPANAFIPELTFFKLDCRRICDYRVTNRCNKCQQFYDMALDFKEQGIKIKKKA